MKLTGKTDLLAKKPVQVPLCSSQIPPGLSRDGTPGLRGGRPASNRLSDGTAYIDWSL
jgi:hypothetical protein